MAYFNGRPLNYGTLLLLYGCKGLSLIPAMTHTIELTQDEVIDIIYALDNRIGIVTNKQHLRDLRDKLHPYSIPRVEFKIEPQRKFSPLDQQYYNLFRFENGRMVGAPCYHNSMQATLDCLLANSSGKVIVQIGYLNA